MNNENSKGSKIVFYSVILADIIVAVMLLGAFVEISPLKTPKYILGNESVGIYMVMLSVLMAEMLYSPIIHLRRVSITGILGRVLRLTCFTGVFFGVLLKLYTNSGYILAFVSLYSVCLYLLLVLMRFLERTLLNYLRSQGRNRHKIVFIGSDPANLLLYHDVKYDSSTGYDVVGYYSNDKIKDAPASFTYLGSRDDVVELMKKGEKPFGADELYCSLSHSNYKDIETIIDYCDKHVIQFYYVPRIYGNLKLNLSPIHHGDFTLFTNHINPLSRLDNIIIKRIFDIVVSGIICLFILPLIPFIWIMIRIQSPGPLLFGQERTGLNGKTFKCWKFRSMHVNADADKVQATKDDPRKFPFGNFMRKTNIDELPQFFNVLLGDMSIVGPRPHMLLHTDIYSELIDQYMARHFSKPGITGWAQVTGYRGETKELWQMEERIKRDIWYNDNWSLWLDIEIIFRTAWSIIHPDKNAY